MSGIYIHIPFCKQACVYCNFHFSVQRQNTGLMSDAICREITLRHDYLPGKELESIYFGGGTPSVLPVSETAQILQQVKQFYTVKSDAEITLEANPDDLSLQKLQDLKALGINRLSIGTQSFFDEDLKWMHRAHNASEARACIENALNLGFKLSLDLIFGSPVTTDEMWQHNLEIANSYAIQHLSCYSLTLEDKTALQKLVARGRYEAPEENKAARQFAMTMDFLSANKWEQYEISNYARNGAYAVHNSNYWKNKPYLGLGPSAHSFNGIERSWNIADNKAYAEALLKDELLMETETLTAENRFNEYLMTGLRTIWGVDPGRLFSIHQPGEEFQLQLDDLIKRGLLKLENNILLLTREGKFYADSIASELFS